MNVPDQDRKVRLSISGVSDCTQFQVSVDFCVIQSPSGTYATTAVGIFGIDVRAVFERIRHRVSFGQYSNRFFQKFHVGTAVFHSRCLLAEYAGIFRNESVFSGCFGGFAQPLVTMQSGIAAAVPVRMNQTDSHKETGAERYRFVFRSLIGFPHAILNPQNLLVESDIRFAPITVRTKHLKIINRGMSAFAPRRDVIRMHLLYRESLFSALVTSALAACIRGFLVIRGEIPYGEGSFVSR